MSDALFAFDAAKEAAPDQSKIIIYAYMSVGGFPAGEMMGKRDLVPILRRLSPPLQKN